MIENTAPAININRDGAKDYLQLDGIYQDVFSDRYQTCGKPHDATHYSPVTNLFYKYSYALLAFDMRKKKWVMHDEIAIIGLPSNDLKLTKIDELPDAELPL